MPTLNTLYTERGTQDTYIQTKLLFNSLRGARSGSRQLELINHGN